MATRFRLTWSGNSPPVIPAHQSYTHGNNSIATRELKLQNKTVLTAFGISPDTPNHNVLGDTLLVSFVSTPLEVQNLSAQVFKCCISYSELSANDNLFAQIGIWLFSNDGLTQIAELLPKTAHGVELNTGLASRFFSLVTTGYNMVPADRGARIVIEISVVGTPTGGKHNATIRLGGSAASDLPETDNNFSSLNPWAEFANTLVLIPASSSGLSGNSGITGLTGGTDDWDVE